MTIFSQKRYAFYGNENCLICFNCLTAELMLSLKTSYIIHVFVLVDLKGKECVWTCLSGFLPKLFWRRPATCL